MTSTLFAAFEVATGRVMAVHEKSQIQALAFQPILHPICKLGRSQQRLSRSAVVLSSSGMLRCGFNPLSNIIIAVVAPIRILGIGS